MRPRLLYEALATMLHQGSCRSLFVAVRMPIRGSAHHDQACLAARKTHFPRSSARLQQPEVAAAWGVERRMTLFLRCGCGRPASSRVLVRVRGHHAEVISRAPRILSSSSALTGLLAS